MTSVSNLSYASLFELDQYYTVEQLNELFDLVDKNVRSLGALLEAVKIGKALMALNVALDLDTRVGQPVYYDTASGTFKRSKLQTLKSAGRLYASESSEAWGIVTEKCTGDRGHILLDGLCEVDLTASTGEASPLGKFYLSDTDGALSSTPDAGIVAPALMATGNGEILFRPWFADTFPRYVPKIIQLSPNPAGTAVVSGTTTSISAVNVNSLGWLPASNAVFEGNQPSGAVFGYNYKADPILESSWPPLEPELSRLFLDPGGNETKGARVIISGSPWLRIDENGIWWMTNCTTQLPWDISAEGATNSAVCPKSLTRTLFMEASFGTFTGTFDTAVSSLKSRTEWLKVYKTDTETPATVGPLSLLVDGDELFNPDFVDTSGTAVKQYLDGQFTKGPVVSGLRSNSPSLQFSGGAISGGFRSGQISMTVSPSKEFDLLPVDVQLYGASTEAYADSMAIGLPPSRATSFLSSFHVPASVPADSPIKLYYWLLAPATGAMPAGMTLSVRVLKRPTGSARSLPAAADVTLNYTPNQSLSAGTYIEADSDALTVSGGDLIYVRFSRAGNEDGVGNEIHVLSHFGTFESE